MRCYVTPLNIKKEYKKPVLVKSDITKESEYQTHERSYNDIVALSHNASLIANCFTFKIEI